MEYGIKKGELLNIKSKVKVITINFMLLSHFLKGGNSYGIFDLTLWIFIILYFCLIMRLLRNKKLILSLVDPFIVIFTIYIGIGLIYSENDVGGILKYLNLIIMNIGIVYIIRLLIDSKEEIYLLLKSYCLLTFVFDAIYIYFFLMVTNNQYDISGRYFLFNINPIPTSMLNALAVYCCLFFGIHKDEKFFSRKFCYLFGSISLITILLSGSKGAMVGLIIAMFFTIKYYIKSFNFKVFAGIFTALVLGAVILLSTPLNSLMEKYIHRFTIITQDRSTIERVEMYLLGLKKWAQSPIIGNGTGLYAVDYPHNVFIEIAAENGSIALMLFLFIIMAIFFIKYKYRLSFKYNNLLCISWGFLIISFITLITNWSYASHKYLYYSLGIFIFLTSIQKNEPAKFSDAN